MNKEDTEKRKFLESFIYDCDSPEEFHNAVSITLSRIAMREGALEPQSTGYLLLTVYHLLAGHRQNIPWLTFRKHLVELIRILTRDYEGISPSVDVKLRTLEVSRYMKNEVG